MNVRLFNRAVNLLVQGGYDLTQGRIIKLVAVLIESPNVMLVKYCHGKNAANIMARRYKGSAVRIGSIKTPRYDIWAIPQPKPPKEHFDKCGAGLKVRQPKS